MHTLLSICSIVFLIQEVSSFPSGYHRNQRFQPFISIKCRNNPTYKLWFKREQMDPLRLFMSSKNEKNKDSDNDMTSILDRPMQRMNMNEFKKKIKGMTSRLSLILDNSKMEQRSNDTHNEYVDFGTSNIPNDDFQTHSSTNNDVLSTVASILLLNLVAVIWGTQHTVIKTVISNMGSTTTAVSASASASASIFAYQESMDIPITNSGFTLARFLLAVLVVINYTPDIRPFFQSVFDMKSDNNIQVIEYESMNVNDTSITVLDSRKEDSISINTFEDNSLLVENQEIEYDAAVKAWRWGLEMGLWMFLGYSFQSIGLEYTTAQRSGFLLYLNVKFVPFFAYILLSRQISIPTWISALIAFCGTGLLSFGDSSQLPFNIGDVWSIAAAMASAMFILRMEKASSAVKDSANLNAACVWTVASFALIWNMVEGGMLAIPESVDDYSISSLTHILEGTLTYPILSVFHTFELHPFAMLYLGAIATALANYIQTLAQKNITAERASIIYAMDPVYGAFFANFVLGETLGTQGMIGAGMIAIAAATNALLDFGSKEDKDNEI